VRPSAAPAAGAIDARPTGCGDQLDSAENQPEKQQEDTLGSGESVTIGPSRQHDLGRAHSLLPPRLCRQIRDLVEAVRDNRPPAITGEDGLIAVAMATGAIRSWREDVVIRL
jgi:predicted dehydrogenase